MWYESKFTTALFTPFQLISTRLQCQSSNGTKQRRNTYQPSKDRKQERRQYSPIYDKAQGVNENKKHHVRRKATKIAAWNHEPHGALDKKM